MLYIITVLYIVLLNKCMYMMIVIKVVNEIRSFTLTVALLMYGVELFGHGSDSDT